MTPTQTHGAVSEDSGTTWTEPGAWEVVPGICRFPLPLPMDGLPAAIVYAIETSDGLALIDDGWAIAAAREQLTLAREWTEQMAQSATPAELWELSDAWLVSDQEILAERVVVACGAHSRSHAGSRGVSPHGSSAPLCG